MQPRQLRQTAGAAAAGAVALVHQDLAAAAASASTASAPPVQEELAAPRAVPAVPALSAPHMVVAVLMAPLRALAPAVLCGERAAPSPSRRVLHATLAREADSKTTSATLTRIEHFSVKMHRLRLRGSSSRLGACPELVDACS